MSAVIIPLPGAAVAPVLTPKLPPGRPPWNVSSIQRGRKLRAIRDSWRARADELEARARDMRERALGFAEGYAAYCLEEAASLQAQALEARQRCR